MALYFPRYDSKNGPRLKLVEVKTFLNNKEFAERYFLTYVAWLGYFGLEMKDLQSGQLQQSAKSTQRYEKVLANGNIWKVSPILASLNLLGFRRYAIQFVKFLDLKIYGNEGFY